MKTNYFIDEAVLAALLRKDPSGDVWKAAYEAFKVPFIKHFESLQALPAPELKHLFQDSFALLVQGLRDGIIKLPQDQSLFQILVMLGQKRFTQNHRQATDSKAPSQPFLAGEVLIALIGEGHEKAFSNLVEHYAEPICRILRSEYGAVTKESPMEVIGESLMAVKANIESGSLEAPLKARLFTYAYRVCRNKFLEFAKKMKATPPADNEEDLENALAEKIETTNEGDYLDYIAECWPVLGPCLENPGFTFDDLIANLDNASKVVLKLRFEEDIRFKEIGTKLDLSEEAARKRLFDELKKWRRSFFHDHVIKKTPSPLRDYLRLYLEKRWSFPKIARHFHADEEMVRTAVVDYLHNWRIGSK